MVVPSVLEFDWIASKGPTLLDLGFVFEKLESFQSKRKERLINLSIVKGT